LKKSNQNPRSLYITHHTINICLVRAYLTTSFLHIANYYANLNLVYPNPFTMQIFKSKLSILKIGGLGLTFSTILVGASVALPKELVRALPLICDIRCEIAASLTCSNPNNAGQTTTITNLNYSGGQGQNKLCNCQGERCEIACSGMGFCTAAQVQAWCTSCASQSQPCCNCFPAND